MVQVSQYTLGHLTSNGREAKSKKTASGSLLQCRGETDRMEAPAQKPETSVMEETWDPRAAAPANLKLGLAPLSSQHPHKGQNGRKPTRRRRLQWASAKGSRCPEHKHENKGETGSRLEGPEPSTGGGPKRHSISSVSPAKATPFPPPWWPRLQVKVAGSLAAASGCE